jgi:hypothetical protein
MPEMNGCLTALEGQRQASVEVIVVEPGDTEAVQVLEKQFPWVHLLPVDHRLSIPEMHKVGLENSKGDIVAILEDHEVVQSGWCEAVLAAHKAYPKVVAIAGPIDNGCTDSIIDWATFFCEYCSFMPPIPSGVTQSIPGNNVTYKRSVFDVSPPEVLTEGFWENTLHPKLLQRGCQFRMEPSLSVLHKKHISLIDFIKQRYHYSRSYAGLRTQDRSLLLRMAYAVACIALPALLLKRILSCGLSKHRLRKELVLSTPYLLCFTMVWAYGEMVGSLFGPGESLASIK